MDPSAKPKQLIEEDNPHILNKILKIATYPVAAFSGLWVAKKEVNDAAYDNLKRYKAFDDILEDLKPKNQANVKARVEGAVDLHDFLSTSAETRTAYRKAVAERMTHMGMGESLRDFPHKWEYINSTGKRNAIIQGMTTAGIAVGALLTIANSKSLIDYFSKDKEKDENSR